jgi:hypothetical protein
VTAKLKQFVRDRCYDFGILYSLEEEFNKIGLTIQATCSGDMILCRLVSGKPIAESLGVDHLFVGVRSRPRDEIPHKLVKCVLEFIDIAAGESSKHECVKPHPRTGHVTLYGHSIGPVVQDMALKHVDINNDLLGAIREWCDDQV